MKLYRCHQGIFAEHAGHFYEISNSSWDELITREDLSRISCRRNCEIIGPRSTAPRDPCSDWQSGSLGCGRHLLPQPRRAHGGIERAPGAAISTIASILPPRPELFFKATPHRVVGPGAKVAIRSDASWSVPEPELVLVH